MLYIFFPLSVFLGLNASLSECFPRQRNLQKGVSLIEVLFALLLLGLTVAASFGLALRATYTLNQVHQSEILFHHLLDLRERMLANPAGLAIYKNPEAYVSGADGQASNELCDSATTACAAWRARTDIAVVLTQLKLNFPQGRFAVTPCGVQRVCLKVHSTASKSCIGAGEVCVQLSFWAPS